MYVDRCLFSLAYQAYRSLCITIVADRDEMGEIERLVGKFDWSGFPRPPLLLAFPEGMTREGARLSFVLLQAKRRFVAVLDMRGTLYTRAYELLTETARNKGAALVYGDAVMKTVRLHDDFIYETARTYRGAAYAWKTELQSAIPLPLGACLLDRARITAADLTPNSDARRKSDEALVLRLLSRYPSQPTVERVPVYAAQEDATLQDGEPGPWRLHDRRYGLDVVRRSLRDFWRRLTAAR